MHKCKRSFSVLLAILLVFGTITIGALAVEAEEVSPFADVTKGDWFFEAVQHVHHHGIMTGTDTTTFAPNAPFTRAMVVATLFRMYHDRPANTNDPRNSPFSDVQSGQWFAPYVTWAYANGIAEGIGAGQFAPMAHVDRQQFAVMLYRYADWIGGDTSIIQGYQWSHFTDRNQIANWATTGLMWANYHGIITGRTFTSIVPGGTVTRAEAATMLKRYTIPPIGLEGSWISVYYMRGDDTIKHPWDSSRPVSIFVEGTETSLYHSWDGPQILHRIGAYQFSITWPPLQIEGLLTYHPENELLRYTFFDQDNGIYVHHFFTRTTTWTEINLRVQFATDEVLDQFDSFHEFVESDEPGLPRLLITTDQAIWNVLFNGGNFVSGDNLYEPPLISYFVGELTPEMPLVITGMDWGATDHRSVSFRDSNGWLQNKAMFQNYDGSFRLEFAG